MAKRTKAQPADTGNFISYEVAVSEAKNILAKIADAERGQLRLGELADKLEPKYKDRTLAKFAAEIGILKCTVERHRHGRENWPRGQIWSRMQSCGSLRPIPSASRSSATSQTSPSAMRTN